MASAWLGGSDDGVPVGDGELAGDEGGGAFGTILDDLGEMARLGVAERGEHPVVEGEQVELGEAGEYPGVGPVAAADGELVQQAGHADVTGGEAPAAGPFDEGASEELLPIPVGPISSKLWRSAVQAQEPSRSTHSHRTTSASCTGTVAGCHGITKRPCLGSAVPPRRGMPAARTIEAVRWYRLAAQQGHELAQENLDRLR